MCFWKKIIGFKIFSYEDWGVDELIVEDSWKRQVGGNWSDFIQARKMYCVLLKLRLKILLMWICVLAMALWTRCWNTFYVKYVMTLWCILLLCQICWDLCWQFICGLLLNPYACTQNTNQLLWVQGKLST